MLDKRLTACAEFVKGNRICDIGTDHAYLVANLLKTNKCTSAIAADINEKPLESARQTLERYGVIEKAQIIQSNGLESIPLDNITDIVIAGMGGELIANILSKKAISLSKINLILQPMSQADFLRKWLLSNGFEIKIEKAIIDGRHFYSIINAVYTSRISICDDVFEKLGMLDFSDDNSILYAENQINKIMRIGNSLCENKKYSEALSYISLAYKINKKIGGKPMLTVNEIYTEMNKIAPMSILHKGDNSGILVGNSNQKASKILLALDITRDVVLEAINKNCDVIISHHPVIYNPLYTLDDINPACLAYKNGIACLCFHSPLDMADGGINDIIYDMLKSEFKLSKKHEVLEPIHSDGRGYGFICETAVDINSQKMADTLKNIFGCTVVRYTNSSKKIKKLAFCSGGAGSNIYEAAAKNIDAYITGDVKHDQWITAKNNDIALFDCGHYYTEIIALPYIKQCFLHDFPNLDIIIAEREQDPVEYCL